METGLEYRELVKVKLQESCELTPKDAANELADLLKAEYVQAIGRKFTLYRESKDHKQIELPR
jgi:RNA-binding protein